MEDKESGTVCRRSAAIEHLVIVDVLESDAESCLHCLLFLPWMDAVNESDYGTYVVFSMMSQVMCQQGKWCLDEKQNI